jgi:hypothetical protein
VCSSRAHLHSSVVLRAAYARNPTYPPIRTLAARKPTLVFCEGGLGQPVRAAPLPPPDARLKHPWLHLCSGRYCPVGLYWEQPLQLASHAPEGCARQVVDEQSHGQPAQQHAHHRTHAEPPSAAAPGAQCCATPCALLEPVYNDARTVATCGVVVPRCTRWSGAPPTYTAFRVRVWPPTAFTRTDRSAVYRMEWTFILLYTASVELTIHYLSHVYAATPKPSPTAPSSA